MYEQPEKLCKNAGSAQGQAQATGLDIELLQCLGPEPKVLEWCSTAAFC